MATIWRCSPVFSSRQITGAKESQLALYSKVSFTELAKHLQSLTDKKLLEKYEESYIVYKTSKKSRDRLDYYKKIRRFISKADASILGINFTDIEHRNVLIFLPHGLHSVRAKHAKFT